MKLPVAGRSNLIKLAPRPSAFEAPPLKIVVNNYAADPSLEVDCDGGMPNRPESLYRQGSEKTPFRYPYFYPY
ncbi:hypothetical protein R69927_07568 [Paraburkholderia domus]|nr:hypothetical protein R69927_07568 [Paraburkholderia domus]